MGPVSPTETVRVNECNAFTFHSHALPIAKWPTAGTNTSPVFGIDIFVAFDPEDSMYFGHAETAGSAHTQIDAKAPHPGGISGGGIWRIASSTSNSVWQPVALLHGIQFGFNRSGWLRGTSIKSWLELVDRNYPDLKTAIDEIT